MEATKRTEVTIGARQWRMSEWPGGSRRYGACEVCGESVETTFSLTPVKPRNINEDGIVGHRACVRRAAEARQ